MIDVGERRGAGEGLPVKSGGYAMAEEYLFPEELEQSVGHGRGAATRGAGNEWLAAQLSTRFSVLSNFL